MPFELLSKEELIIAAIATKRPVAFLVGAPLSLNAGAGVPGVTEILTLVRDEINRRAAFALPRFETSINGKTGGEAYQEGMKWVGRSMGQDALNDIIKAAVLKARKTTALELTGGDGVPTDWNIPDGTASLGELVARESERFRGPILTTNFDPLISLAVRNTGGRTGRRVLSADGTLAGPAEDEICTVIHLHGFWRDSDTLHTQAQLTNPRPKLTKSLQRLLQGRTLIVAAYGGWDDVFTQALVDLMNDEQAPLDVIWCFYETDAGKVQAQHEKLLSAVEPAIVMNRFRAFGGIDCHSIFAEILDTLRGASSAVASPSIASPVAGWELIDASYLGGLEPLRPEEVLRYFDGATPSWRHARCPDIPSRNEVSEIARRLEDVKAAKSSCSLQLIRAAGGEGKTTLLLQAAAAAALSGDWNVLWRPAPRLHLSPEHIGALDSAKNWLIVADDAENLVTDLSEAARLLHENGQSHVHFLVAARDTDWRHFNGDKKPWHTWIKRHPHILLRELVPGDAVLLVKAWQKYGSDGLRGLAALPEEQQATELLGAVHGAATTNNEGSFFGGLLAVRFGPEGLRDHVIIMLNRLKELQIKGSDHTLFDALVFAAACHSVGIQGIDEKVLADLVGVPRDWVQTLVVNPLGEEAAAVRCAGHILTRHSSVAAAILVAAEQDLSADIAEIWSAIVRQTVRTGQQVQMDSSWFSSIIHVGPQLQRNLPLQFSEQRRKEIAVAAARADAVAESDRLCPLVDLGKTYRYANDIAAAAQLFRDNLHTASSKVDFNEVIRGYWYEWGGAEGRSGGEQEHALRNAWLCGLSLADFLQADITEVRIKLSCAGTGVAFGKLAESPADCPFALGRRATAFIGLLSRPDNKTAGFFRSDHREADKIGTPQPKNINEAIGWLTAAVVQAGRELHDPFLKGLLKPEQVSFNLLRRFIQPQSTTMQNTSTPPAPVTRIQLQKIQSGVGDRIKAGIERVMDQASKSVPAGISGEERFQLAKRKASEEISRLSPSIRREVGAYFQTQNWDPLKERLPNDLE